MRGAISLGVGTIVGIILAIAFVLLVLVIYENNMGPIPGLIENLTQNVSVVVP
jgi:hypothetical protein